MRVRVISFEMKIIDLSPDWSADESFNSYRI